MRRPSASWLLVLAQFALLGLIAAFTPWARLGGVRIMLFAGALALAAWAAAIMGGGTLSVFPEPKAGGRLALGGPYRMVRHPMYLAVLLAALALGSAPPPGPHTASALLLVPVVLAKVRREERMLDLAYPDRTERMRGVALLVPGLW